jgi:hypothetical protein
MEMENGKIIGTKKKKKEKRNKTTTKLGIL